MIFVLQKTSHGRNIQPLFQRYLTRFKDKIPQNHFDKLAVSMPKFKEKKEPFSEKFLQHSTFSQNYEKKTSFCHVFRVICWNHPKRVQV